MESNLLRVFLKLFYYLQFYRLFRKLSTVWWEVKKSYEPTTKMNNSQKITRQLHVPDKVLSFPGVHFSFTRLIYTLNAKSESQT